MRKPKTSPRRTVLFGTPARRRPKRAKEITRAKAKRQRRKRAGEAPSSPQRVKIKERPQMRAAPTIAKSACQAFMKKPRAIF
jgi:hypothetical protein